MWLYEVETNKTIFFLSKRGYSIGDSQIGYELFRKEGHLVTVKQKRRWERIEERSQRGQSSPSPI